MKKTISLLVLAFVMLSLLCGCAANGMSLSLVGLWNYNTVDYIEITNEGKFTKYSDNGISPKAIEAEGNITESNPLYFTVESTMLLTKGNTTNIYYEVGCDELHLSFNEGSSYTFYKKVK